MYYFIRYRNNLGERFGYEKEFKEDSFYIDDLTSHSTLVKLIKSILPKDGNDYMNPTHSTVNVYCVCNGKHYYSGNIEWVHNDLILYYPNGIYGTIN